MKPVIALVGRTNVGKSTLFNRLTKSRDAIVADFAGLTRDRHYGDASAGGREFIVIDTGGFEPDKPTGIVREMARQTEAAVAEADAVIFVTDIRAGLTAQDHDIARYLRERQKRVVLAVNKAEGMADSPALAEFHELGIGEPHPVSAAHGQGIRSLVDAALAGSEIADEQGADEPSADKPIRLAVAGRPNVGKSTLINVWLGEERLVAFDQPGTTRDAIHVPFERGGPGRGGADRQPAPRQFDGAQKQQGGDQGHAVERQPDQIARALGRPATGQQRQSQPSQRRRRACRGRRERQRRRVDVHRDGGDAGGQRNDA